MNDDLRREMIEYLRGGAKPRAAWRTGLELELIGYRDGDLTRLDAGDLAAIIAEEAFEYLDGPVRRITAPNTPVPYSPPLEEFFLPKVSDVVRVARELYVY